MIQNYLAFGKIIYLCFIFNFWWNLVIFYYVFYIRIFCNFRYFIIFLKDYFYF